MEKRAKEIRWNLIEDKFEAKLTGTCYLRSNLLDKSAADLRGLYHTLQAVETAFRFMKSSLGMRPVYHQNEKRVDGHLMDYYFCLLSYSRHSLSFELQRDFS